MLMRNECAVCILNQIIRATGYMKLDKEQADILFKEAMRKTVDTDYSNLTPPEFSGKIYEAITGLTGIRDPYRQLRKEQNDLVLENIDLFRERINRSEDPLFTSVFYSLLGNIIDYGGVEIFDISPIFKELNEVELTINDFDKFRSRLDYADSILIISDNAGEAVFDMLLLEQIKRKHPAMRIFYGVRSGPAINDIIREDAEYIGIGEYAEIIETGSTYAGTMINRSDPEFVGIFNNSDIVISKGQGNFETLEMEKGKEIFFIFKVKCKIVSEHSALPVNSLVLAYRNSILI